MDTGDIYLTKEGHEKLMLELEMLKNVRRKELSRAVAEARQHGDISENAEYDAAKDAQALNEKRIAELEGKLACARILDENIPDDEVLIGATVEIEDCDTQERLTYMLVSEMEADYSQNRISVTSPVGQGLLGRRTGEIAEIKIPAGTLKYKILSISR